MNVMTQASNEVDYRDFARAVGAVVQYGDGDVIFRETDPADCMYVVLSGTVVISSHDKDIEVATPGMALGFLSVIDGLPRTTTARAKGRCELALLDRRRFRYMVEEVPNFVWYVMGELAHRLRTTTAAL